MFLATIPYIYPLLLIDLPMNNELKVAEDT
jgi:hypothetical protein